MGSFTEVPPTRPESGSEAVAQLQVWSAWRDRAGSKLSNLYCDKDDIRQLVERFGYERGKIPVGRTPFDVWKALIDQLFVQEMLGQLFFAVTSDRDKQGHWEAIREIEVGRPSLDPALLTGGHRASGGLPEPPKRPAFFPEIEAAMETADGFGLFCTKFDELASARMSLIRRPSAADHSTSLRAMFQPQLNKLERIISELERSQIRRWAPDAPSADAMAASIRKLRISYQLTAQAAQRAGTGSEEERQRTWDELAGGIQDMSLSNSAIIDRLFGWFRTYMGANQTVVELQTLLRTTVCPLFVGWDKVWETVLARYESGLCWDDGFWNRLHWLNPHEHGQVLRLDAAYVRGLPDRTSRELSRRFRRYRAAAKRFTQHRRVCSGRDPTSDVKLCFLDTARIARDELKAAKEVVRIAVYELRN